tara:strand:+ start:66 stop:284 length:219 start_codon:yes stop_codon:yes gene_type:complete
MKGNNMNNLDLNIFNSNYDQEYSIEITENYEDDKFHVVVFETDQTPNEHYETKGFDTEKQVYDYLKQLQNNN